MIPIHRTLFEPVIASLWTFLFDLSGCRVNSPYMCFVCLLHFKFYFYFFRFFLVLPSIVYFTKYSLCISLGTTFPSTHSVFLVLNHLTLYHNLPLYCLERNTLSILFWACTSCDWSACTLLSFEWSTCLLITWSLTSESVCLFALSSGVSASSESSPSSTLSVH